MTDVTHILNAIEAGDARAAGQLSPLVYDELRQLAAAQMAHEKPGQTLDATALVHEVYLRLVPHRPDSPGGAPEFANRRHFFAAAAEAMRRILIENARRKRRHKHGAGMRRHDLHPDMAAVAPDDDLVALDEMLVRFARRYPVHARLVELRYFAGLTGEEAAHTLGISPSTADRHWVFARAWLRRELRGKEPVEDS